MSFYGWLNEYRAWQSDYAAMCARIAFLQAIGDKPVDIENTEPDNKNLVPISDAEAYRAIDALSRVNTLLDMGIHTTTKWRIAGRCRYHGEQAITLETNDEVPENLSMRCFTCTENGAIRWLDVTVRVRINEETSG